MKLINVQQAKEIDRLSIHTYGIPGQLLMENAGFAAADEVLARFPHARHVVVVCGKGNNGGDGSVVARQLQCRGIRASIILVEEPATQDSANALAMAQGVGVAVCNGLTHQAIALLAQADVIVDAVLGIGATGAPQGAVQAAIDHINQQTKPVVSLDVPSGLNADTGSVAGSCVESDVTVTFGLCKQGLLCHPGKQYAGAIVVREISFAPQAVAAQGISVHTADEVPLPGFGRPSHKGASGKVLCVAGSVGMTGAAALCATAAMRMGCGLVTVAVPESLNAILEQKVTEVMTLPLPDVLGTVAEGAAPFLLSQLSNYDAVLCGCGLSQGGGTKAVVRQLIANSPIPLVLDADGLNVLAGQTELLRQARSPVLLTPHIGEMARLAGLTPEQVQQDTLGVAKRFAEEYNVIVVLKSAHTVIALPDGTAYLSVAGNDGMATAGSGDVLAGILTALVGQGVPLGSSAPMGVHLHGTAGDLAAARLGKRSLLAGDLLDEISQAIKVLERL